MNEEIELKQFRDIDLNDTFFDSLKEDYPGFDVWFNKKSQEGKKAYVQYSNNQLQAFLHLKFEDEKVEDVVPNLPHKNHLKVATFKIDAHNTKLGERFVKKIVDEAIYTECDDIYVTIFPKHEGLIRLLSRYGFGLCGKKGEENVYVKNMRALTGDSLKDYPLIKTEGKRKFLLSVKPEYHTKLFPDSILKNEENQRYELIKDVSSTNSIHKIYICFMKGTAELRKGDLVVIYRTKDDKGPAKFRSVATSVCEVEELKQKKDFSNEEEFIKYTNYYSVFSEDELKLWYKKYNVYVIKMTYNIAFPKRVTRSYMIDNLKISYNQYWGFFQLNDDQFQGILDKAEINEGIIIN